MTDPSLETLGKGEREAIALAELYRHESGVLLLLDEQAARQQAATRRIAATGTLGVLKAASAEGWIELKKAFDRLRQTNFRVAETLLQSLLDEEAARNATYMATERFLESLGSELCNRLLHNSLLD